MVVRAGSRGLRSAAPGCLPPREDPGCDRGDIHPHDGDPSRRAPRGLARHAPAPQRRSCWLRHRGIVKVQPPCGPSCPSGHQAIRRRPRAGSKPVEPLAHLLPREKLRAVGRIGGKVTGRGLPASLGAGRTRLRASGHPDHPGRPGRPWSHPAPPRQTVRRRRAAFHALLPAPTGFDHTCRRDTCPLSCGRPPDPVH